MKPLHEYKYKSQLVDLFIQLEGIRKLNFEWNVSIKHNYRKLCQINFRRKFDFEWNVNIKSN